MGNSVYKYNVTFGSILFLLVLLFLLLLKSGNLYNISNGYTEFDSFEFWTSLTSKILYCSFASIMLFRILRNNNSQTIFYSDKLVYKTSSKTLTIYYTNITYVEGKVVCYVDNHKKKKFCLYGRFTQSENEKANIKKFGEKNVKHISMADDLLSRLSVKKTKKKGKITTYYIN